MGVHRKLLMHLSVSLLCKVSPHLSQTAVKERKNSRYNVIYSFISITSSVVSSMAPFLLLLHLKGISSIINHLNDTLKTYSLNHWIFFLLKCTWVLYTHCTYSVSDIYCPNSHKRGALTTAASAFDLCWLILYPGWLKPPLSRSALVLHCFSLARMLGDETEKELKMLRGSRMNKELGHITHRFVCIIYCSNLCRIYTLPPLPQPQLWCSFFFFSSHNSTCQKQISLWVYFRRN